jgi:hypothetical protein
MSKTASQHNKGAGRTRERHAIEPPRSSIWRGPLPIIVIVAGVALILIAIIVFAQNGSNAPSGNPQVSAQITSTVINEATHISPAVYDQVGSGGVTNPIKHTGRATMVTLNNLPAFDYEGATYCPYCAAERWSIVAALSRFGTLTGLGLTQSSSTDVFPDTPTFDFETARLQSPYIAFREAEVADRSGHALQTPASIVQSLDTQYNSGGGIPFISIGGELYTSGAGYAPSALSGLDWSAVGGDLANAGSNVTRAIIGNANFLTAGICVVTNGQPQDICGTAGVQAVLPQVRGQ